MFDVVLWAKQLVSVTRECKYAINNTKSKRFFHTYKTKRIEIISLSWCEIYCFLYNRIITVGTSDLSPFEYDCNLYLTMYYIISKLVSSTKKLYNIYVKTLKSTVCRIKHYVYRIETLETIKPQLFLVIKSLNTSLTLYHYF